MITTFPPSLHVSEAVMLVRLKPLLLFAAVAVVVDCVAAALVVASLPEPVSW